MDEREEVLQLRKIDLIEKMVILLEEIAYRLTPQVAEKLTYIEALYASNLNQTASLHGDVRARPAAREREVPQHDTTAVPRLREHTGIGTAQKQKKSQI